MQEVLQNRSQHTGADNSYHFYHIVTDFKRDEAKEEKKSKWPTQKSSVNFQYFFA